MVQHLSRQHPPFATVLTSLAAALVIGWAGSAGAQTTGDPTVPLLPPAAQPDTEQSAPPQADAQQQQAAAPANNSTRNFPALPLGHDGVRDVQSQLIALGFDPGAADGEAGPATVAAAQQYNENRGGSGPVPIDGALLARLQQDTAPRLTPEQVAARTQPHYQAPATNPLASMMQQFQSNLRTLFNGGN
jgi:peptidoglycan hydrolase-like protein with peptidoglycan-binding domain